MPRAVFQRHLPHEAKDLIAFVSDVERYPEFIKAVSALRIIGSRKETSDGQAFEAEMRISYKLLSESLRCNVSVNERDNKIIVRKSGRDGVLRALSNDWVFHPLSDGSTFLDFNVDVELKSAALNFLARQKFDVISAKIMDLFVKRAAQICPIVETKMDLTQEIASLDLQKSSISKA